MPALLKPWRQASLNTASSVNSIPFEVFMDVDMRSESPQELSRIDAEFKRLVREAVDEENRARSTAPRLRRSRTSRPWS